MELPKILPKSAEQKRVLGEFYDLYKDKPWFVKAEFVEMHPNHLRPTIQVYCENDPASERTNIAGFAATYGLALEILVRRQAATTTAPTRRRR